MMLTFKELNKKALQLWDKEALLRSLLAGDECFPLAISCGKPSARELLHNFTSIQAEAETLVAHSKKQTGRGYVVHFRDFQHRKLGAQRLPEQVVFTQAEDWLQFIRKHSAYQQLIDLFSLATVQFPPAAQWLAQHPLKTLALRGSWAQILRVCVYLQENDSSHKFSRELPIPGVDSKFIEQHYSLLKNLMQLAAVGQGSGGDALNFKRDAARVRYRWLTPRVGGYSDLSVPLHEFAALELPCRHVFIVENLNSGLSFPMVPDSILIFGMGYAVSGLREAKWLRERDVHYWGDLDSHGFAILSACRECLPHLRSFLMTRECLLAHRSLWVEEPPAARFEGTLAHLTEQELAVFTELQRNQHGYAVRLEQERIDPQHVWDAVRRIVDQYK